MYLIPMYVILFMCKGDSPPSAVWEETQWGQLNVSRYVADMIGKYLPGTPAFTAIGNHGKKT